MWLCLIDIFASMGLVGISYCMRGRVDMISVSSTYSASWGSVGLLHVGRVDTMWLCLIDRKASWGYVGVSHYVHTVYKKHR